MGADGSFGGGLLIGIFFCWGLERSSVGLGRYLEVLSLTESVTSFVAPAEPAEGSTSFSTAGGADGDCVTDTPCDRSSRFLARFLKRCPVDKR